ncbi:AAA family ATPase [Kocuria sp.]|uniref:AAA family ATPase n=1 Tax=Kocuria sp. TaxID=1871328 RepID=UPI0026E08EF0|nr:AAA family ATPase [Kocuria sp.]MDO5619279.1 AAA family ATPase [Kocuria sp.]
MIRTVCGPPGAGKTTWVADHAQPADLVIDLDALRDQYGTDDLARSVRSLMESKAREYDRGDVWIIRTLADAGQRADHARRVGADEVVVLETPADVATARARDRDGNDERADAITRWWDRYSPTEGETHITPDTGTHSPDKENSMPQDHKTAGDQSGKDDENNQVPPEGGQAPADQGTGFPAETPLAEMTGEQREAYWKHQARKHEKTVKDRADYDDLKVKAEQFDQLQEASKTPDQKALDAAIAKARADTLAEVADERVRSAFQARGANIAPEALEKFLSRVNLASYIGADGTVDVDQVADSLSLLNSADTAQQRGTPRPTHQGFQRHAGASSVAAGRALFEARQGTPKSA